ncbi:hypothetical protein MRX96_022651 [Rhipicephalus microplus]
MKWVGAHRKQVNGCRDAGVFQYEVQAEVCRYAKDGGSVHFDIGHAALHESFLIYAERYEPSTDGLWCQDMVFHNKRVQFLRCTSRNPQGKHLFWIKVVCRESQDMRSQAQGILPSCTLLIVPPIVVHNALPCTLELHLKGFPGEIKLDEGDSAAIFSVSPNDSEEVSIEVPHYLGFSWKALPPTWLTRGDSSLGWFLYAPYWIINKTGLPLQIRGSNSELIYNCNASCEEPLLFRFKKRKHKRAKIRVYNSSWSSSFSLDTMGNSGVAVCKDRERSKKYRIQMSSPNLSKMVIIRPFFLVVNNTKHHFQFMEENESADLWFDIGPHQVRCSSLACVGLWPK